jgi:cytochrome P450
MLFGGIETTEGMIANALLHLLSSPAQLELVLADRGRLEPQRLLDRRGGRRPVRDQGRPGRQCRYLGRHPGR